MRKTETVLELERAYGKPLAQLVIETYDQHGSVRLAAEALGVRPGTFYSWMRFFGIAIGGKRAIPRERDVVPA